MGILYALFENDLKRVLAYSTIENIGFIFVGLGLALAFRADRISKPPPCWRFTGRAVSCFNHSLLKSLLFFGSGAVLNATGERDLERLGGLIHRMPVTALAMLGGCSGDLGTAAVQRLCFRMADVSRPSCLSPELPQWGLKLLVPAAGALLALAVALAAACFVRLYGIAFLGRARRPARSRGAGDRPLLARCHAGAGRALPARRHSARPCHRCHGAGTAEPVLGGHMPQQASIAWLSLVPHQRRPQFL